MYEIKTSDFNQDKIVKIDGKTWRFKQVGAGTQLSLAQLSRKQAALADKYKDGETPTPEDNDKMLELYATVIEMYEKLFRDETPNNTEVKEWVRDTPIEVIEKVVEAINEQTKSKATSDEQKSEKELS